MGSFRAPMERRDAPGGDPAAGPGDSRAGDSMTQSTNMRTWATQPTLTPAQEAAARSVLTTPDFSSVPDSFIVEQTAARPKLPLGGVSLKSLSRGGCVGIAVGLETLPDGEAATGFFCLVSPAASSSSEES